MRNLFQVVKATALGGLLFLIPFAVVLVVVGKVVGVMLAVAKPIGSLAPADTMLGMVLVNVLAVVAVLVLCFVAGLLAANRLGKQVASTVESGLLSALPGYAFVKGFTDSMAESDEMAKSFVPVLVRFDDYAQIAFEVERTTKGYVALYLPGAPNPWSGSVVYVTEDRVERLEISAPEAIKNIRTLGRGSDRYT